jgi:hypothetical protein
LIDGLKITVKMGLDATLCIGDKCNARSVVGKNVLILPEKIKTNF